MSLPETDVRGVMMSLNESIDELIDRVPKLDRRTCVDYIHRFDHPRLDFTDEFLERLSDDRLRHILLAACLQARRAQA